MWTVDGWCYFMCGPRDSEEKITIMKLEEMGNIWLKSQEEELRRIID